jgi:nitronate monooxygenase
MKIILPKIIQGGMGASISDWGLAKAVSLTGQLGVVSGTALDAAMVRRLQDGDLDGSIRRALSSFPFPKMAKRILDAFFVEGGKAADVPYKRFSMHDLAGTREPIELCIVGNFVEVFLAKEGHENPVGINYLEKIQLPHLPSIYGALLAGVSVVIMGAGIPLAVPEAMAALTQHEKASYPINVDGLDGRGEVVHLVFDPADYMEEVPLTQPLARPDFLPIVSSELLAKILIKKSDGAVDGFIIEGNLAGGHNAPPRVKAALSDNGEPIYGDRDVVNLEAFRKLGLPFWIAGNVGSEAGLSQALKEGAAGVQVGTAFALCSDSGMEESARKELVREAVDGKARVFTDPLASPTGFPFKVADLAGSLSDSALYEARRRICDLGTLRLPYRKADGSIGFRCAAEPVAAYVAKGGKVEDTVGRKCLCNALSANAGKPQVLPDGSHEKCLITLGDDLAGVERFCSDGNQDFSAADVVKVLLGV